MRLTAIARLVKKRGGSRASGFGPRLAIAAVLGTLLVSGQVAAGDAAVRVTVTTKPVHSLVAQVMEGVAEPLLIVDGAASAHTFTLRPSSARAVADASVFIRVSDKAEPFTRKLVEGLPKNVLVLSLADEKLGVNLLAQRESGAFDAHVHDAEGQGGEREPHGADDRDHIDAHIWLDPQNAKAIVAAVARVLGSKWPQHAAAFTANAEKTAAHLDALTAEVAASLAPLKAKPFVVFHDAYQYFEVRFGLPAAGAITLSPDQPPSAKRLTQVREKIRSLHAGCVFAEPGFQPKLLAAVTEGEAVYTGNLDPEGQSLTPGPKLYEQLLRNLSRDLQACLART